MVKGTLYIISAPSGGGKTSLVKAMAKSTPHVLISISHTTRQQRLGEKEGVHYHFVSDTTFIKMLKADHFLEHAHVFGYRYGTTKQWVNDQLHQGQDIILEIDWQGAQQIKKIMPDAVSIFILPPSLEVLQERLIGRRQDEISIIEKRMALAVNEISHYDEFDYMIVNDEFDLALRDIQTIIRSRRLSVNWVKHHKKDLLKRLIP